MVNEVGGGPSEGVAQVGPDIPVSCPIRCRSEGTGLVSVIYEFVVGGPPTAGGLSILYGVPVQHQGDCGRPPTAIGAAWRLPQRRSEEGFSGQS